MSSNKPIKQHYFMISALAIFADAANHAAAQADPSVVLHVQQAPLNRVLVTAHREIGVPQLANAQQLIAQALFSKVPAEKVEIVDIVITNMMHLGFMTEGQFQGPKSNEQLQAEALAAVAAQTGTVVNIDLAANEGDQTATSNVTGHAEEVVKDEPKLKLVSSGTTDAPNTGEEGSGEQVGA